MHNPVYSAVKAKNPIRTLFHRRLFVLLLFQIAFFQMPPCMSQPAGFQKIYGGPDDESFFDIRQTVDGGFILVGNTQSYGISNGLDNILLLKTDSAGSVQWARAFGDSLTENASCVRQGADSTYWITGRTYSHGSGNADIFLLHTDASGNLIFYKTFGGSLYDAAQSLSTTADGGCVMAGGTYSIGNGDQDMVVIKTDANGTMQWQRITGSNQFEQATCIQPVQTGGFILGGRGVESGSMDILLSRLDETGNLVWSQNYSGSAYDESYSICQSPDGSFLISGSTVSFGNNIHPDFILIHTDTNGTILASRIYGGPESEAAYSIHANQDSGFIVTGYSESYSGLLSNSQVRGSDSANVFAIRVDASLDTMWSAIYGGPFMDESFSVIQKNDGGFGIAAFERSFGNDSSRAYLISTTPSGLSGCQQRFISPEVWDVTPVTSTDFFQVFTSGIDTASFSPAVFTISPADSFLCPPFFNVILKPEQPFIRISPNPFQESITVDLSGWDEQDKLWMEWYNPNGIMIHRASLISGLNHSPVSSEGGGFFMLCVRNEQTVLLRQKMIRIR